MSDPTQFLPDWMLAFLNIFVQVCHLLNHYLGYGIGYLVFALLLSIATACPGIKYWSHLRNMGMSSEEAANQSLWVAMPLFVAFLLIGGYVYFHGGNVSHPV